MLYLNTLVKTSTADMREVARSLELILTTLKIKNKDLSITLCSRQHIQKLNRRHRQQNKPTDVLSFPMDDQKILGDVFVCPAIVRMQAARFGNTYVEELLYMIVHGICHLLGHDHATPRQTAAMRSAENRLLAVLKRRGLSVKGRI
jgi:probable rRNA maturation factor